MADRKFNMHDGKKGSALAVRITPRASRNEIVEVQDDGTVKVRLAASPTDDEVNTALLDYLSEILGVSRTKLDIVAGAQGYGYRNRPRPHRRTHRLKSITKRKHPRW
jgi:uncharacterized protein